MNSTLQCSYLPHALLSPGYPKAWLNSRPVSAGQVTVAAGCEGVPFTLLVGPMNWTSGRSENHSKTLLKFLLYTNVELSSSITNELYITGIVVELHLEWIEETRTKLHLTMLLGIVCLPYPAQFITSNGNLGL